MSAREQAFHAEVSGGVAGRDFINHIHIPQERPESEIRAAFKRDTGIDCNREARELLEMLMHGHNFTTPELRRAYNTNSLLWSERDKSLKCASGKFELSVGWTALTLFALALAVAFWGILSAKSLGPVIQPSLIVLNAACAYIVGASILNYTVFAHYTAKRAAKILADVKNEER